jgi:DNA repair protein RadC
MKPRTVFGGYEVRDCPAVTDPQLTDCKSVLPLLKKYRKKDREHFLALYLNARSQLIWIEVVSVGTLSASLVHPREVFKGAILNNAAAIIIAHNHPSGDPAPSPEDKDCTRRLKQASELLGITLLDHIILGRDTHVSFKELGLL